MVGITVATTAVVLTGVFAGCLSLLLHPSFVVGSGLIIASILLKLSKNIMGVLLIMVGLSFVTLILFAFNRTILSGIRYIFPVIGKYVARAVDYTFGKSSSAAREVARHIPLWSWSLLLFLIPFAGQFIHSLSTVRMLNKYEAPSVVELPGIRSTSAISVGYTLGLMIPGLKDSKWMQPQRVAFLLQTFWLFSTIFSKRTPENEAFRQEVWDSVPSLLSGWGTFILGYLPPTAMATAFTVGFTASAVAAGVAVTAEGVSATRRLMKDTDEKQSVIDRVSKYVISWKDVAGSWKGFSLQDSVTQGARGVVQVFSLENIRAVLPSFGVFGGGSNAATVKAVAETEGERGEGEKEGGLSEEERLHTADAEAEEKVAGETTSDVVELSEKMEDAGFDIQSISPPANVAATILVLSQLPTTINLVFGVTTSLVRTLTGRYSAGMILIPIMMAPLALGEVFALLKITGVWGLVSGSFVRKLAEKHDGDGLSILLQDSPKLYQVWRRISQLDSHFKEQEKELSVRTLYEVVDDYINPSDEVIDETPEFSSMHIRLLVTSIIIDLIGVASFGVPVIGELFDVIWAPISGYIIHRMYGVTLLSWFGTIEELLPFTDIIPTATIAWFYVYSGYFPAWVAQSKRKLKAEASTQGWSLADWNPFQSKVKAE